MTVDHKWAMITPEDQLLLDKGHIVVKNTPDGKLGISIVPDVYSRERIEQTKRLRDEILNYARQSGSGNVDILDKMMQRVILDQESKLVSD